MKLNKIVSVIFVFLISVAGLFAQNNLNLENGFKPYGSYDGSDIEMVNLANGNLIARIPVPLNYPQRGGLKPEYFFVVNSKIWTLQYFQVDTSGYWQWTQAREFGVPLVSSYLLELRRTRETDELVSGVTETIVGDSMVLKTPDGASHTLGLISNNSAEYVTLDTSAYHVKLQGVDSYGVPTTAVVTDRRGNRYQLGGFFSTGVPQTTKNCIPQVLGSCEVITDYNETAIPITVTDPNGNVLGGSATPSIDVSDTLGRTMLSSFPTNDYSDCVGPTSINSATLYTYPALSGGTNQFKVCYGFLPISTNFSSLAFTIQTPSGAKANLPVTMVLPDHSKWILSYDNYGNVINLGLPLGGSISYTWTEVAMPACDGGAPLSRAVQTRTVSDGRGNSFPWSYAWGTVQSDGTLTNVVTDPLGNDTMHVFSSMQGNDVCHLRETATLFYQGARTSGQLVKRVDTHYQGQERGSPVSSEAAVPDNIKTTVYPSGKVSLVTRSYDSGLPAGLYNIGDVVSEKSFDWGIGSPGALLRESDTIYQWQVNSDYAAGHMLDLPASVVVKDGNGSRVAETDYTYDEPDYLTVSNISTQHIAAPATVRGNLTTISKWLNTSNSLISSHTNWYDTGEVYQQIDPLGNTTTHSYDPAYAGAYSTQTLNALGQRVSGTYDFNTGLLTSFSNANAIAHASGNRPGDSAHTITYTYDLMSRVTSATFPPDPGSGGSSSAQTIFTYAAANTFPFSVQRQKSITPGVMDSSTTYFDGLGRPYQTQHLTPTGTATVNTTFDSLNRVSTVTNPFYSTSDLIYGIIQSQYDALGRVTQVTKQDNSVSMVVYDDNCITTTDEAGKQRKSCSDGLGRLIEVDEPGGGSGNNAAGTFTVNGALQNVTTGGHGATRSVGSVTINPASGSDRSTQAQGHAATSSAGSVTISGAEQSVSVPSSTSGGGCDDTGCQPVVFTPGYTIYDSGVISIMVNGHINSYLYNSGDDIGTIARGLAAAINSDGAASATANASGATVVLTSKATGSAANYSLSTTVNYDTTDFHQPSFIAGVSGGVLTGGINATNTTVYDAGTVTVTVNGHNDRVTFGQNDTANAIVSRLVTAINSDGEAFVTASASGNVVNLVSKNTGAATNASLSSAYTYDTTHWSSAFFTTSNSGSVMAGGTDPVGGTQVYDAGMVQVSVGGFSANANYSQSGNSTAAQVASALASALNAGNSPVTASTSGATVSLTYKNVGASGNIAVSVSSSTSQTTYFSNPSFTSPGMTLAGGVNPVPGSLNNPYVTLYQYDALSNLLRVDQKGSAPNDSTQWRTRTFTYNSLSQLLTATNPESGTISYVYDNNGNLLRKTSPAPNQNGTATQNVSYCYDALNRVTGKAYSVQTCTNGLLPAGTAVVSYTYDSGTNGIGHITNLTDQAGSASYTYDIMDRLSSETRTINGVTKTLRYSYNLDGSVATITYPSGAVVTYTPDAAGRTLSAVDSGSNINYVTGAAYNANGALTDSIYGKSDSFTGIVNSFSFNNRLQPATLWSSSPVRTLMYLTYDFHLGNGDNGNVYGITNTRDTSRNQAFTYDPLNRLASAQNAGTDCSVTLLGGATKFWGNSYSYDAWGNLIGKTVTKCSAENLVLTATANNQLQGYSYDAAGNMTHDLTTGNNYTYDPESRITGAGSFIYTYDADGNRVEKSNGTTGTLYWYMTPGIVGESDLAGNLKSEYIFFNGQRVARKDFPGNTVSYYFSDHLKTASVITDAVGNIKSESDYYPWGGELQFVNNDSNHYKFTGKERDGETGLDYFGARSYSSLLGRWTTPDWAAKPTTVPYANFGNPQSLNLYSYVNNNPMTLNDPDGHELGCSGKSNCTFDIMPGRIDTAINSDGSITVSQTNQFTTQTVNENGTLTLTTTPVTTSVTTPTSGASSATLSIGNTTTTLVAPNPNGADGITVKSASTAKTGDTGSHFISPEKAYQIFGGGGADAERWGHQMVVNAVFAAEISHLSKRMDGLERHLKQFEHEQRIHNQLETASAVLHLVNAAVEISIE